MTHTNTLAHEMHTHIMSGVGVTAIRTRDPVATINEAVAFCAGNQRPIRVWDAARGWLSDPDPIDAAGDESKNLIEAFKMVLDPTVSDTNPHKGVYVFSMVHHHLNPQKPNPELLQVLTILAHNLPQATTQRRILIAVPVSYTFPPELRELVPVIDHPAPGTEELSESIENVVADMQEVAGRFLPELTTADKRRIAQAGAGMIVPEMENALSRVIFDATKHRKALTSEDIRSELLAEKAGMVRRSRALEVMEAVQLDQVGGLGPLKAWLQTRVRAMDPAAWEAGVDKPKGVALVGPPGTGKSLVGKVIGSVLGVATIRFNIAAVFEGLVGSSETNMREALFMLRSLAPCVVLLDEVDKVLSTGPSGDSGTSQKVMGELLTFMQESKEAIFWVPTLNRTQNVPAEFLRAGRLDEVFGVSKPNARERLEILTIHLRKRKVDVDALGSLESAVKAMEGFVGAEIEQVASAARLAAYNADRDVTEGDVTDAASRMKPLSKKMADQFTHMENWCKENAIPANDESAVPDAKPKTRQRRRVADAGRG